MVDMRSKPKGVLLPALPRVANGMEDDEVNRLYEATGEYRPPRKGEFFVGAGREVYKSNADLSAGSSYWIARPKS